MYWPEEKFLEASCRLWLYEEDSNGVKVYRFRSTQLPD